MVATAGTVATAFLTDKSNVYAGVCIDASAGMGFCAEHATEAMIIVGAMENCKNGSDWCI